MMKHLRKYYFLLILLAIPWQSSAASGVGVAVVTESDGRPCFGLSNTPETRDGLPLYSLLLSEVRSKEPGQPPEEVWIASVIPNGKSIPLMPGRCIQYGQKIANVENELLRKLEPYTIYSIFLNAKSADSHLMGYSADFCFIPTTNGSIEIINLTYSIGLRKQGLLRCSQ